MMSDVRNRIKLADWWATQPHNLTNPMRHSYEVLKCHIEQQYQYMRERVGIHFVTRDPYVNSGHMFKDVRNLNTLKVLITQRDDLPKDHPMREWYTQHDNLLYNDIFRAVHDYWAHYLPVNGFGCTGEDNAYIAHRDMLPPAAWPALFNETRAQNTWFWFGPHVRERLDNARTMWYEPEIQGTWPARERPFAEQKVVDCTNLGRLVTGNTVIY